MTVFHANGRLHLYKRLVMGFKPAQGELNAELQPLFAHITQAHIIRDDLIIATSTQVEHEKVFPQVKEVILTAGLTLNPKKGVSAASEINFWGLIVNSDGVRPEPEKVEALNHISPPRSKDELIGFLCMMQLKSDFIPNFSKRATKLRAAKMRALTHKTATFKCRKVRQQRFDDLLQAFKKEALLQYFDGKFNRLFLLTRIRRDLVQCWPKESRERMPGLLLWHHVQQTRQKRNIQS